MEEQTTTTPTPTEAVNEPETSSDVLEIPREVFNYFIVGVIMLIVGGFTGFTLANQQRSSNEALINQAVTQAVDQTVDQAVSEAVAQALASMGDVIAQANPPSMDNPNSRFTVADDGDPSIGPEDAEVVVIEFSDFNCSFCGRWANQTLNPLIEAYGDRVRFVYRDFPILAESSVTAALAGQCAHEQGQFWEYHNVLFSNQGNFGQEALISYATEIGLDTEAFTTCLEEQRFIDSVATDAREAQSLGIRGTPAFFVNGRPISGAQPYDVFAAMIEEELAAAETAPAETGS